MVFFNLVENYHLSREGWRLGTDLNLSSELADLHRTNIRVKSEESRTKGLRSVLGKALILQHRIDRRISEKIGVSTKLKKYLLI